MYATRVGNNAERTFDGTVETHLLTFSSIAIIYFYKSESIIWNWP